ncbi:hypothetical protein SMA90_31675, partial [Escherichia coli]
MLLLAVSHIKSFRSDRDEKRLSLLLVVLIIFALFVGCAQTSDDVKETDITSSEPTGGTDTYVGTTGNTEA